MGCAHKYDALTAFILMAAQSQQWDAVFSIRFCSKCTWHLQLSTCSRRECRVCLKFGKSEFLKWGSTKRFVMTGKHVTVLLESLERMLFW